MPPDCVSGKLVWVSYAPRKVGEYITLVTNPRGSVVLDFIPVSKYVAVVETMEPVVSSHRLAVVWLPRTVLPAGRGPQPPPPPPAANRPAPPFFVPPPAPPPPPPP